MTVTTKNFSGKLAGISRSIGTMKGNVQELLGFGFAQYAAHGNTVYLNKVAALAINTKAINAGRVKDYIKAHANVKYCKLPNGEYAFKKETKKADKIVLDCAVTWWEFNKPTSKTAPTSFDATKRAVSWAKLIQTKINEGTVSNKKQAKELVSLLNAFAK